MRASVIIALAMVILVLGGVAYWLLMKGGLNNNDIVGNAVKVEGVDLYAISSKSTPEATFIKAVIRYSISAPNIVSLDVGGGELNVTTNGIKLFTLTVPPQKVSGGTNELEVTGYLQNNEISKWWVTHLKRGEETNVSVDGYVSVGLAGRYVQVPVHQATMIKTHIFPVQETLNKEINLGLAGSILIKKITATLTNVTEESTNLKTVVKVKNNLKIPIILGNIAYSVTLPDGTEVAKGYIKGLTTIPVGSEKGLAVPVSIANNVIPKLWYFIVQGKGKANLTVNIWFRISYGSISINILENHPIRFEITVSAPIMKFK